MTSVANNNNKDDESKGEDITNNNVEVMKSNVIQEMSEMNIIIKDFTITSSTEV